MRYVRAGKATNPLSPRVRHGGGDSSEQPSDIHGDSEESVR